MQSLAPSEYFEGIKFNYSFYTTGETKVTLEYVNNNFLKCTGYAYSRAISTSFNGIIYALGGIDTTTINASGLITSTTGFKDSGAELSNLNASNISNGTTSVSVGGTGLSTLALGQLLIGNDTNPITQSANLIWDITNNNLGIGKNPAQKLDVNGTIAATLFSGSGASLTGLTEGQIPVLTAAKIPDLDAAKITAGTINNARLPAAISVTSFTGDGANITAINATNIATGTINNARLPAVISVTSFAGDGASITNINASNIATGTINNDRLTLTGPKVFDGCESKTFILNPSNKVDIPPVYSFNITSYDRLANTTATYLEAGKFTCTYEDRNGTYKLIPSNVPNVNNKVILNYRVGDKITFKNTANTQFDYAYVPAQRWARLSVFKMPSGAAWNSQGMELYMTSIFDWDSDLTTVVDWTTGYPVSYPRNTPVTMQIEAGFKYFFVKWQRTNAVITFDSYITPATEVSGMNIAYGGGQGFKISGDYSGSGGYKPISSSLPPLMTTDTEGTARRGSRLTIDNGVLSADIPISSDLITIMKPEHFINNTGTSKIEISSAYVAPNATKLATVRNIAGVSFDGSGAIDIPYANLTNKPTLFNGSYTDLSNKPTLFSGSYTDLTNKPTIPAAQVSSDWNATTGVALILNKPTLFSGSYTDLTNKPTIPAAQVSSDWNATTGVALILNKPTLFSGSYTDLTNKPTIPAAQVSSDWNATTVVALILNKPTIPVTPTSANLIGIFNTTQFTNNTTTNKIDISTNWKPNGAVLADTATTTGKLTTAVNIGNVSFDGSSSISISYLDLTNRPWINPSFSVNYVYVYTTRRVKIGDAIEPTALLHLIGNATAGGTILLEYQSGTPNIELMRGLTSNTTDFNWNILNDNNFRIQNKTSTNAYADRLTISSAGSVRAIGDISTTNNTNEIRLRNTSAISRIEFGTPTDTVNLPSIFRIIGDSSGVELTTPQSRPFYLSCCNLLPTVSTITKYWTFLITGNCVNATATTTWDLSSDHRIKENIKKADLNICYNNVKNINVYRFNYINGFKNNLPDKTQLGFIAQQVKQHFPKSVSRDKIRLDDKRGIPDLASVSVDQLNFTLFGAVKQLIRVVEKQSKLIKKLEEMLNIIDDDEVEDDTDEPYTRINCEDECDIDTIQPSEPEGV